MDATLITEAPERPFICGRASRIIRAVWIRFRSIGMAPRLSIRRPAGSRKTRPGPASLERDTHQRLRPLVAEHPSSIHSRVSLMIDAGAPHRLISGRHRARHEQVPPRSRLIAFHLDVAIQAVMDREGEDPRRPPEEAADRLAPFKPAQGGALP